MGEPVRADAWTKVLQRCHRGALRAWLYAALCLGSAVQAQEPRMVKIALSDGSPPTSFVEHGEPKGMIVELMQALFSRMPGYKPVFQAFPWPRAQLQVQAGEADLFCTFPSESRKQYASFAAAPMYVWDYGNLVYDLKNPNRRQIENAKSFEDLRQLTFISQEKVEWEQENVPAYIKRQFVNRPANMWHMAFLRKAGDFFIMSPEQAVYYAKELGYEGQLGMRLVRFIPNSQVPFHLGVRKSYSARAELLAALEAGMKDKEFLREKKLIEKKYSTVLAKH